MILPGPPLAEWPSTHPPIGHIAEKDFHRTWVDFYRRGVQRLPLVLLVLLALAGCGAPAESRPAAAAGQPSSEPSSPSTTNSVRDGDACNAVAGALSRYPTTSSASLFVSGLWQSATKNLSSADDPELVGFGRGLAEARSSSDWDLMVIVGQNAFRRCQSLGHTPEDQRLPEPRP
jgi:hypothetical protein